MREDIERKTKKLDSKAIEKGGEGFQDMQRVQNQILQIQAEREKNLAEQRAISGTDAANNQTLAQAAGAMAIMSQDQQVGSNTQAVLGRYGYPQTQRSVSKKSSKQVLPGGNIVVNNNTVNNVTTNNGGYGGPIQGRPLQFKSPQDNGTGKFKAWLSNAFARQNEQAAVRDREYRKREWSLARASNRMAKKLESISKSVGERLNPERIGTTLSSQLKSLLFLFGTAFLVKNWANIMDKIEKIETFFTGGSGSWKDSGLSKTLVKAFGGKENETVGQALYRLFWDDTSGSKGLLNLFLLKLGHWFEEGTFAAKKIPFPDLSKGDNVSKLVEVAKYLGDVISTTFSGGKGFEKSMNRRLTEAQDSSIRTKEGEANPMLNRVDNKFLISSGVSQDIISEGVNVGDWGGNTVSTNETAQFLHSGDIKKDGTLTGTVGSLLRQTNNIVRQVSDEDVMNIAGYSKGLSNIDQYMNIDSKKEKPLGLPLGDTNKFFKSLGLRDDSIESLRKSGNLKKKKFTYVIDKKTDEEVAEEKRRANSKDKAMAREFINTKIREYGSDFTGITKAFRVLGIIGGCLMLAPLTGGSTIAIALGTIGAGLTGAAAWNEIQNSPWLQSSIARAYANNEAAYISPYTIRLVPQDEINGRPIYSASKSVEREVLDYQGWTSVKKSMGLSESDEFNLREGPWAETSSGIYNSGFKELGNSLEDLPTNKDFDVDLFNASKEIDELKSKNQAEFDKELSSSRGAQAVDNISEMASGVLKSVGNTFGGVIDYGSGLLDSVREIGADFKESTTGITVNDISDFSKTKRGGRNKGKTFITKEEARDRVVRAMDYLMKTHGFTPEQAAGMVGNFIRESGMNHDIYNFGGGEDYGLAQWLSKSRKDNFRKWFGKDLDESSFEEQLQFVSKELENTHKTGLNAIRNSQTVDDAAAATLGYYEFSAGPKAAMAALDKANAKWVSNAGWRSMDAGIKYGRFALDLWKKAKNYDESGESEKSNATTNETTQLADNSPKIFLPDEPTKLDTEKLANYSNNWASGNSFGLTASYKPSSSSLTPTSVTPITPTSITPVKPDKPSNPMDSSSSMDKLIANSERQIQATEALAATMTEVGVLIANSNRGGTTVVNNNVNNTSFTPGFNNNNVKE